MEAPANVNEKTMGEPLLDTVLGDDIELEFVTGDSQLDSQAVFDAVQARKVSHIIAGVG